VKRKILTALLMALGGSCAPAPLPEAGSPRASHWRLAERDGLLVFECVEDGARGLVEVRFSGGAASVGEVVEAEIRLPGETRSRLVEVRPDGPGVVLLGPARLRILPGGSGTARFTRSNPGRGGLIVLVLE
jgi:hypothetical protein